MALLARGEEVEELARGFGERALGLRADMADTASLERAVEATAERFGRIDVLVNNAAIHRGGQIAERAPDELEEVLRVDLVAPWQLCRLALPHLSEGAAVVNVGAVVGFRGFPGDSLYGAAKAGLAGMTRVLSVELARYGVSTSTSSSQASPTRS